MEKIISYGCTYIILAVVFVALNKEIIQSNKNLNIKLIQISLLNFLNYCLLLYCYRYVSWIAKWNKFHNYPYRYPFCIFVFICCIIVFVISGIFCVKYQNNMLSVAEVIVFLIITHVIAILLLLILRIPFFLGL